MHEFPGAHQPDNGPRGGRIVHAAEPAYRIRGTHLRRPQAKTHPPQAAATLPYDSFVVPGWLPGSQVSGHQRPPDPIDPSPPGLPTGNQANREHTYYFREVR